MEQDKNNLTLSKIPIVISFLSFLSLILMWGKNLTSDFGFWQTFEVSQVYTQDCRWQDKHDK